MIVMPIQSKKIKVDKKILTSNIEKIHTTKLGANRIKKNLKIDTNDITSYCKELLLKDNCICYRKGKNIYCEIGNIRLTINIYSFTIITAHKI